MEPITIKGKIEFCDNEFKRYDREFTAILHDSAAFEYGNRTAVTILWGVSADRMVCPPVYLDTRYDPNIKRNKADFKEWIRKYFKETYSEHTLIIY